MRSNTTKKINISLIIIVVNLLLRFEKFISSFEIFGLVIPAQVTMNFLGALLEIHDLVMIDKRFKEGKETFTIGIFEPASYLGRFPVLNLCFKPRRKFQFPLFSPISEMNNAMKAFFEFHTNLLTVKIIGQCKLLLLYDGNIRSSANNTFPKLLEFPDSFPQLFFFQLILSLLCSTKLISKRF